MSYTLTLEDIKNYLESLQPQDTVGKYSSVNCLGANALRHKYGIGFYVNASNLGFSRYVQVGGNDWEVERIDPPFPIPDEVRMMLIQFDFIAGHDGDEVTKEMWDSCYAMQY